MNPWRIAFLVALALWPGCASQAPPPVVSPSSQLRHPSAPLVEEFDPQSLDEDLLLIQPTFAPPVMPATLKSARPFRFSEPPGAAVALRPSEADSRIFRVHLMALADGEVAAQRRQELVRQLDVPVHIEQSDNLFLVRAGAFSTAVQAERFKARLATLSAEYADAYVVVAEGLADSLDALRLSAVPAPDDTADTSPLVAVFGWRVRLDKVDSYQQAESIRATAVSDLRRTDIDITFTTPYYNIEVGHYRTEVEAQQALERLRRRYPYALMARGQILVPAEE